MLLLILFPWKGKKGQPVLLYGTILLVIILFHTFCYVALYCKIKFNIKCYKLGYLMAFDLTRGAVSGN